jgi:hypothetical protein
MKRFHFAATSVVALALFLALSPGVFAAGAIPLTCNWEPTYAGGRGVFGDGVAGTGEYKHGTEGVQCYFGVNARDVDMVTYNTGRTLRFVFDVAGRTDLANDLADLPDTLDAEVDLFGVNHWGRFVDMGIGTTAQIQMDLEFHDPTSPSPRTFELDYSALAVRRLDSETWLITSQPNDPEVPFSPVNQSPIAKLNEVRRRGSIPYGEVVMPIRFKVTLGGSGGGGGRGPKNK